MNDWSELRMHTNSGVSMRLPGKGLFANSPNVY